MAAAGQCRAQSKPLEANIPFAFEAGNKTMPAGNYRIESMQTGAGSVQVIRGASRDLQAIVSTSAVTATGATPAPELIFHRYGNHYFLAQIRTDDGRTRELLPSRQEKEVARSQARSELTLVARAAAKQ